MRKARLFAPFCFFSGFMFFVFMGCKVNKSRGVKKGYVVIGILTKPQASNVMTQGLC